jgi:hypothetical protein
MKKYQYHAQMYHEKDNAYTLLDYFYTLEGALRVAEGYAIDRKTHVQVIGKEGIVDEFPKTKTRKKVAC